MFLEQIKQFIICACLEIQIQKRLFQQATLSQGKQKNGQTWAGQSPQRLSWNDKWSPHISHLDYLENKITCWHCFFFSPAVHKTQKAVQVPQNSWQHYMHYAQTYLLHKAIVSFFSTCHGPDQKQNWDVNHEKDPDTKQLFQLCQVPFCPLVTHISWNAAH